MGLRRAKPSGEKTPKFSKKMIYLFACECRGDHKNWSKDVSITQRAMAQHLNQCFMAKRFGITLLTYQVEYYKIVPHFLKMDPDYLENAFGP